MKKTLQEIKEEEAKNLGYNDWGGALRFILRLKPHQIDEVFDSIARKYTNQEKE